MRKALLKTGYACNNNCVFCHAAPHRGVQSNLPEIVRKLRSAAARGAQMVVLSGGEPTIHQNFRQIVERVADCGLGLGLVSNARRLTYPGFCEWLLRSGLEYAYISLCGAEAITHDRHVRAEAFDQTLCAIRNLAGRVRDLTVNVVITSWNLDQLERFLPLAAGLVGVRLKFSLVEPEGAALEDFERLVPDLDRAAGAVRALLRRAQTNFPGVPLALDGFPLCSLSESIALDSGLRREGFFLMSEAFESGWHPIDDRNRGFGEDCPACRLRQRCRGVFLEYLRRRGAGELRPVPATARI